MSRRQRLYNYIEEPSRKKSKKHRRSRSRQTTRKWKKNLKTTTPVAGPSGVVFKMPRMNPGPSGLHSTPIVYTGPPDVKRRKLNSNATTSTAYPYVNVQQSYGYHGRNAYCVNPEPSCLNLGSMLGPPPINTNVTYGRHGRNAFCVNPEPSCLHLEPLGTSRPSNVNPETVVSISEFEFCVNSNPSSVNMSLVQLHSGTQCSHADNRIIEVPLLVSDVSQQSANANAPPESTGQPVGSTDSTNPMGSDANVGWVESSSSSVEQDK